MGGRPVIAMARSVAANRGQIPKCCVMLECAVSVLGAVAGGLLDALHVDSAWIAS